MVTGEKFLVAATLEPVAKGEEFETIPPHMTVIGWLALHANQQHFLYSALDRIYKADYYQDVVGAKKAHYGPENDISVRTLKNVETAPWKGLHALIESLDGFPKDNFFNDVFSPHISDTPERKVKRGEHLALPTIAVFSKVKGVPINHVEAVYPLGEQRQV
jgi:hypothetical protein